MKRMLAVSRAWSRTMAADLRVLFTSSEKLRALPRPVRQPIIRWGSWGAFFLGLALFPTVFALVLIALRIQVPTWIEVWERVARLPVCGAALACVGGAFGSVRRIRRKVVDADHLICLECAYPLAGLPAVHRCPECGAEYRAADVRNVWARYFPPAQQVPERFA